VQCGRCTYLVLTFEYLKLHFQKHAWKSSLYIYIWYKIENLLHLGPCNDNYLLIKLSFLSNLPLNNSLQFPNEKVSILVSSLHVNLQVFYQRKVQRLMNGASDGLFWTRRLGRFVIFSLVNFVARFFLHIILWTLFLFCLWLL
jgi:hypothetical protein